MTLRTELQIRTPEGIVFSYALAGPISRCMAWAVDVLVVIALNIPLNLILKILGYISVDFAQAANILGYFILSIGYGIIMEWGWRGQTLGKRMMRLRVMDAEGLRMQFHQVLLRNLLRAVDLLPGCYLIGGVASLTSRKAQRLGDLAAGTIVVHLPRHSEPDLEQLLSGKFNSLREHPHLAARLRQRVTPEEAGVALHALLRRDALDSGARVDLFAKLAAHFKQVVPFPEEVVESVPDEQYVRNVVDILFRARAGQYVAGPATTPPRTATALVE